MVEGTTFDFETNIDFQTLLFFPSAEKATEKSVDSIPQNMDLETTVESIFERIENEFQIKWPKSKDNLKG